MPPRLIGRGRLPDPKNLKKRNTEGLLKLLARFGRTPDVGAMESAIFGELVRYKDVEFADDDLIASIQKAVERKVKNWLVRESRAAIHEYRMAKMKEQGVGKRTMLRWIAVVDKGTCPSCIKRHQEVRSLRAWEKRGLPGSTALICQMMCRCHVVPVKFKFPGDK